MTARPSTVKITCLLLYRCSSGFLRGVDGRCGLVRLLLLGGRSRYGRCSGRNAVVRHLDYVSYGSRSVSVSVAITVLLLLLLGHDVGF